ncbi:hypothetical protein PFISCL1PPCAC_5352, partial [Pristionchus fissidentatus]
NERGGSIVASIILMVFAVLDCLRAILQLLSIEKSGPKKEDDLSVQAAFVLFIFALVFLYGIKIYVNLYSFINNRGASMAPAVPMVQQQPVVPSAPMQWCPPPNQTVDAGKQALSVPPPQYYQ